MKQLLTRSGDDWGSSPVPPTSISRGTMAKDITETRMETLSAALMKRERTVRLENLRVNSKADQGQR